jgi:tetratricopeptide (TPR) repeat protein
MILLGEGFCEMVISTMDLDGSITYGDIIQPDSVFELAIGHLENATGSSDASIQNMAYLGLARAYLNLGDYAQAQANAELVDAGFLREVSASAISARRENKVWQQSNLNDNASNVAQYYRDLGDPRVPVVDKGETNTLGRPIFYQTKYATSDASMPLATYEEALLIIAEAELEIGDPQVAVGILSDLRVAAGQGTFASTDPAEIRAELIEQRRRELFLEGHHLNDFIRFELPYQPGEDVDDPYFGSGQYGDQRCLPLPLVERQNNPNIQ